MRRRTYLATTTTALATVLAGCTSDSPTQQATTTTTPAQTTEPSTTTETTQPTTKTTTAAPASFKLVSVDAPREVEIGTQASYSFTVKNTGGSPGTFETTISTRTPSTSWSSGQPWTQKIPPGETRTLSSGEFTLDSIASYQIRIDAFDHVFNLNVVGATHKFGSPFTHNGIEVNVRGVGFMNSYTWSSGNYEYEETTGPSSQFAEVEIWAKNQSNSAAYLPTAYNFALIAGNSQYDPIVDYRQNESYEGGQVQPDIVRQGSILYEIPSNLGRNDVKIVWTPTSFTSEISVYWSQNPDA